MFSSKIIGCGLLFILCLVGASMGQDELQDELEDLQQLDNEQQARMKGIMGLLKNVQSLLDPGNGTETMTEIEDPNANSGCGCRGRRCRCCRRINVRGYFCKQVCLNVVYLRRCNGFLTTLRLGGRVMFSQIVYVRHPRPLCARIRIHRKRHVSVCLRLNHLRISRGCVSACDAFVLRQSCRRVARVSMGCFSFRGPVAEMSAGPMPNNYCDVPPKSIENLQQQQQQQEEEEEEEKEEEEEEMMTPVPEFEDIEAGMVEDIEELSKTERDDDADHVVRMDNNDE